MTYEEAMRDYGVDKPDLRVPLKLTELTGLVKDIESAAGDSPVAQWLLPHMTLRTHKAGTPLFSKGDTAEEMFYAHRGEVRVV